MRLEIYAPRASPVHALHPATKLALLLVALVAPFLTHDLPSQLLALAAALAVAAAGRVTAEVFAPWKLVLFIGATTFALYALQGKRSPGGLSALAFSIRVCAVFFVGIAFLATTRIEEIVHALEAFFVPYRVAFALALAFRLVPLFLGAAASITEAQRARGLDLESGNVFSRMRKYVPILVPVFMTSLRDADQMAMALDARGFGAPGPRTRMRQYPLRAGDAVALALGAAYLAAFIAVRHFGPAAVVPA